MADETPRVNSDEDDDRRWHWGYVIPMMALLIPILAVTGGQLADFVPLLVTVAIIGGLWGAGRSLLGYRHELRIKELEVEREIAALEAERLKDAQKVLDLDDGIAELKQSDLNQPDLSQPDPSQPDARLGETEPPTPA